MNVIQQRLDNMQRDMDELQRCIDEIPQSTNRLQRHVNDIRRNMNDMQREINADFNTIHENQIEINEDSRKQEPQTAVKKSKKFSEYSNGDITHVEIDGSVIDIKDITSTKKKFKKIIGSLSRLLVVDFLQKTQRFFSVSLTARETKTPFKYDQNIDLYFQNCSIQAMVEFLDHFFNATKIPFKMEFTREDKKILYFNKNCNEY